jgi:hypothetical protein
MKSLNLNYLRTFTMLAVMMLIASTAWAETVNVGYKDADGTTKYVDATVLNNTMNNLAAGWYVVNSDVTYNGDLETNGNGDVNIILCDGATLTANNITPTLSDHEDRLIIYGQSQGTGTANISGTLAGCNCLTIYGGTINVNTLDGYKGSVGINGGTVNAGRISPYGGVSFNGGNVIVTDEVEARNYGNIFLSGGTVKASSYSASGGYVCISKGLTYYDGTGASYTGTEEHYYGFLNLTDAEITAIAGKTLRTFNYGSCGIQTVNDGNDVTWMMSDGDNNGSYETLIISGSGAMADFSGVDAQPWKASRADIKKVKIEPYVTGIGNNAFKNCTNLKTVLVLGKNLPSLGMNAFDECTSLSKIYLSPSAYDEYGTAANWSTYSAKIDQLFYCGKKSENDGKNVMCYFTDDDNDDKIETLTIIGTGAIMDCSSAAAIWDDFRSTIKNLFIEEGVTEIGNSAFKDCTSLTTVDIPASVTHIRPYAFKGCTSLTTAPIGSGVIYIGNRAFEGCTGLTSATIPAGLEEPVYDGITQYNGNFGLNAFEGCTNLTTITVAADNPTFKDVDGVMMSKDGTALVLYPQGKTATNYIVPDGVKSIIQQAFKGSSHLTDVTLPDGLTTICMSAFQSCTGLTSIVIPASVTNIETMAFRYCSNLKTVLVQRYDADDETKIMTLGSSDVFEGCPNDLAIYVPYVALNVYKEATNWSTYSDKINAFPVSVTIGDETTNYTSFAEAVAYAGEMYDPETPAVVPTVTLYDDINLGGSGFEFGDDENAIVATLDLNGHTISGNAEYLITVAEKSTLTVAGDGSIVDINYLGCLIENNGTLNITGGTYGNSSWMTNNGTMTVSGGTFTAYGGFVSINNYDGSLTVSGGTFNVYDGGCAINNRSFSGTPVLTLSALPTFVHPEGAMKGTDIDLNENTVITFDKAITTFPTAPIVVKTKNTAPYVFTSGYGTYVKDGDDNVVDPASMFTVTADNSLLDNAVLGIHASEAALFATQTVSFPEGKSTYYSAKGLKLLGENDKLKFYTVTNAVDDVAEVTEIAGKTFGKETPLIVSNESSADIDAVMVHAFDDADDAVFAASCATDLGEKSVFSGFKGTAVAIDEIGFNNYKAYFGFTGHDFVKISKDGPVLAHRCWLEMGGSSNNAPRLTIRWNEEEVTGVKGLTPTLSEGEGAWYTLDGRKLNGKPTAKGIYIYNGNKRVVK